MKNIYLSYILAFSKNSWFWLGIWVFYYLRFTDYAGIGVIETVLILTMTLAEIPTGAIADLLGKKFTLFISFFLQMAGNWIMAYTTSYGYLLFSVFIMALGGTFYSGTLEALVYDSLKVNRKESLYDKKIANVNSISLLSPALCGIVGGFLYKIDPRLPFIASALGYTVGVITTLFLTEPKVDTVKFSLRNFLDQTKQGIRESFKTPDIKHMTLFLLSIGVIVVIADEMLNAFLGVEFGFSAQQLGIFWSAVYLISAFSSQLTPKITKFFKNNWPAIFTGILISITFLISPFAGLLIGGLSLALRSSLQSVFNNLVSARINNQTDSRYRATTLSTFNMIKNIPYVLFAYFIGTMSDTISAKNTAFILGIILLIFILPQIFYSQNQDNRFKPV